MESSLDISSIEKEKYVCLKFCGWHTIDRDNYTKIYLLPPLNSRVSKVLAMTANVDTAFDMQQQEDRGDKFIKIPNYGLSFRELK